MLVNIEICLDSSVLVVIDWATEVLGEAVLEWTEEVQYHGVEESIGARELEAGFDGTMRFRACDVCKGCSGVETGDRYVSKVRVWGPPDHQDNRQYFSDNRNNVDAVELHVVCFQLH